MAGSLTATRRTLAYQAPADRAGAVDVLLDGHRVWSTVPSSPDPNGIVRLAWPAALRPYLRGAGELSVQRSDSGEVLAHGRVAFGSGKTPLAVRDGQGRRLTLNKWGRMGASIEGDDSGMRERLVARTKVLTDQLEGLGYATYITGGTLLGAVRNGDLLPHDDDTDLGVLLDHSHPSDLSLDSYRLEDELIELGYTVVRHSTSHLQLMFLHDDGRIDHYIDIFSSFYRGPHEFCQPFHVRADVPRSSILPIERLQLAGRSFPSVHRPDDWLAACYGPNWQTPDPSFRFETPLATRRRFENWFGSQNKSRVYWESVYAKTETAAMPPGAAQHTRALARVLPKGVPVLDLGCGTGAVTRVIASHGHSTIGLDYSYRALAIARQAAGSEVEWRYGNVNDRRRLLELGADLVRDGRAWHVSLNHLLEGITEEARANVFLFLRLILRQEAVAVATVDTNFITRRYHGDDPQSWHLPLDWLQREAAEQGIEVGVVGRAHRRTEIGRRATLTAVLRRRGED
ncbi:MAG TPA: methyltransferase domain-containing protein [Humibacter sp.]|nr:methyltransferase domain-containing protein [Humibacter sp.]